MSALIDTHTHLYDEAFSEDLKEVAARAKEAGVAACVLPAIDSSCHSRLLECAGSMSGFLYPCVGLHPTSVGSDWESELNFVIEESSRRKYYAVGEIGMDGYWSREFMKEQAHVFNKQLELASSMDLPVIIHSRDSFEEIFEVLEKCRHLNLRGVFHAFSGSIETFRRISKYGNFKIGIGGVVTFKNAHVAKTVKEAGLENIILETDSPWLTPAPFRGKRNEPAYVAIVAGKLAEIFEVSEEEIAATSTANAVKLFNLH